MNWLLSKLLEYFFSLYYRARVKTIPCIISRDCIGGVLYKRMKIKFNTPTIKLYMNNEDFIRFCLNIKNFVSGELKQIESIKSYPVGTISTDEGLITIHFIHYDSFEQAKVAWDKRKKRIDYNNIRIILNAEPNVEEYIVEEFKKIPYKKILLSSNIKESNDCVNMKCYENGFKGPLVAYKSKSIPFLRYMDEFDWIKFINE